MNNAPVFYETDKLIYEDVYFLDALPKDMSKYMQYCGRVDIKVGTYKEHSLYIRGYVDLIIDPNLDFNDEQFNLFINLFPDDGSFIFDVETLDKYGDYEKAKEILDDMWNEYESICDKYWKKYMDYEKKCSQEVYYNSLKCLEELHSDQYKQLIHLSNSELKFPIYGCFTSKRGTFWHYCIYGDLIVEQWHSTTKRVTGGWKQGNDVYSPKCTKELKQYIKEKYGIEVRDI